MKKKYFLVEGELTNTQLFVLDGEVNENTVLSQCYEQICDENGKLDSHTAFIYRSLKVTELQEIFDLSPSEEVLDHNFTVYIDLKFTDLKYFLTHDVMSFLKDNYIYFELRHWTDGENKGVIRFMSYSEELLRNMVFIYFANGNNTLAEEVCEGIERY